MGKSKRVDAMRVVRQTGRPTGLECGTEIALTISCLQKNKMNREACKTALDKLMLCSENARVQIRFFFFFLFFWGGLSL